MQFERIFTTKDIHPFDDEKLQWTTTDASISAAGFEQKSVEFPKRFSQNAINIISQKYFAGKVGDEDREYSLKQLINRVVDTMTLWGLVQGYFGYSSEEYMLSHIIRPDRVKGQILEKPWEYFDTIEQLVEKFDNIQIFNYELKHILVNQMAAFNSPVWFNLGNKFNNQQVSACFINDIYDDLESIADNNTTEMMIFRDGSGAGKNSSRLRSSTEDIRGGGKASGAVSFMRINDATAGVTKSGGKSRRAAKMEILDIDHGDIEEFIKVKGNEERKAKLLMEAGYPYEEAYNTVAFQNSNFSVRITDIFMQAVEGDREWALLERTHRSFNPSEVNHHRDGVQGAFYNTIFKNGHYLKTDEGYKKVIKWHKAKDLFSMIAKETWETGDPGLQFHDIINNWHTCTADGEIAASNPCSEYMFLNNTSCNLASINLMKFYTTTTTKTTREPGFDMSTFQNVVKLLTMAMDIIVEPAHYPTKKIGETTRQYRTLGLGYANLGALLMASGIPYDSEEGRDYAAAITALMHGTAYKQSWLMGEQYDSFPAFDRNKESVMSVIEKHVDATSPWLSAYSGKDKYLKIMKEAASEINAVKRSSDRFAMRNAQVTVLAPTGTIAFIMDCDTTGIEPAFSLISHKQLSGGGDLVLTLTAVNQGLDTLGYNTLEDVAEEHMKVFATAVGDNAVTFSGHISMMAAVQPFLSGAISKTVNIGEQTTKEQIENIYHLAWKQGLKAIAVYRDNSKGAQPMSHIKKHEPTKDMGTPERRKLEHECEAIRTRFNVGGVEGYVHVGLYNDGTPGEIFIRSSRQGSTINGMFEVWALTMSIAMQYGVPLEAFVNKFTGIKFEPSGITESKDPSMRFAQSIPDYIAKWLSKEFLDDDTDFVINQVPKKELTEIVNAGEIKDISGEICNICGGMMISSGKCHTCTSCGESTGCG